MVYCQIFFCVCDEFEAAATRSDDLFCVKAIHELFGSRVASVFFNLDPFIPMF